MCGNTGLPEKRTMSTADQILEETRTFSESEACALLDFIGYLKYRRAQAAESGAEVISWHSKIAGPMISVR